MSGGDDNVCSICLEPLLAVGSSASSNNAVCAANPCGHCFHEICFQGWRATVANNNLNRGRRSTPTVKCPNCNVNTKGLVKLFLSAPEAAADIGGGSDSDLESILDSDSVDKADRGPLQQEFNNPNVNPGHEEDTTVGVAGRASDRTSSRVSQNAQVITIDSSESEAEDASSMVASNAITPTAVTHRRIPTSTAADASMQRLKKLAIKYKKRSTGLEQRCEEHSRGKAELSEQHLSALSSISTLKKELDDLKENHKAKDRELDYLRLFKVQNERYKTETSAAMRRLRKEHSVTEQELHAAARRHEKELETVRKGSMAEVQEMLQNYPQLCAQNQQYQKQIAKLNAVIQDQLKEQRSLRTCSVRSASSLKDPPPSVSKLSSMSVDPSTTRQGGKSSSTRRKVQPKGEHSKQRSMVKELRKMDQQNWGRQVSGTKRNIKDLLDDNEASSNILIHGSGASKKRPATSSSSLPATLKFNGSVQAARFSASISRSKQIATASRQRTLSDLSLHKASRNRSKVATAVSVQSQDRRTSSSSAATNGHSRSTPILLSSSVAAPERAPRLKCSLNLNQKRKRSVGRFA